MVEQSSRLDRMLGFGGLVLVVLSIVVSAQRIEMWGSFETLTVWSAL
ncbi:MAG: hypothetical protein U9R47_00880 [Actinomycetota bacterium]|nr:hypothetical protein [Actinomycetota bacterium]